MGNTQDRENLGVSPWYSVDEVEKNLKTGDIVLFSSRSYVGRSVRWASKSFFNHVGIVIKVDPFTSEPFVMDVSVCRSPLFKSPQSNTLIVGSQITTLRSKMYSGLFDLVAVRPLKLQGNAHHLFMNVVLDEIRVLGKSISQQQQQEEEEEVGEEEDEKQNADNDPSPRPVESAMDMVPLITNPDVEKKLDPLTIRLLELSMYQFELKVHEEKMQKYYKPVFFDTKFIYACAPDDVGSLVSAEYVAMIFHKLGIFDLGATPDSVEDVISKFKAKHFTSNSKYELPLTNIVRRIDKEMYLYLDFQVYDEDLIIRTSPQPPLTFPRSKKSLVRNVYTTDLELQQLGLKNGDLVLISEEGIVSDCVRKITNCTWTRIGLIVSFPGISKPFVYEVPPLYLAQYEFKKIKSKLLEGRMVSLSSIMQNEYYSRIAIRRLRKRGAVDECDNNDDDLGGGRTGPPRTLRRTDSLLGGFNSSALIHAAIELNEKNTDSVEQRRLEQLFNTITDHGQYGPDIQLNVSSILSGYFVAVCYKQLGLLKDATHAELFVKYPVSQFQSKQMTDLQRGYYLDKEFVLKNKY